MPWSIGSNVTAGSVLTASRYNQDVIENLTMIGGAWTSYTPTYTSLTVGNGTVSAARIQAGKLNIVRFTFTLGSTSAVGTIPEFTLPATANTNYHSSFALGRCHLYDVSTDQVYPGVMLPSTDRTKARFFAEIVSGTYNQFAVINATVPFTFATGDVITTQFFYEAA